MTTSCCAFGSATPKEAAICGSAGSMMSIDIAVSAIIAAIMATNSGKDGIGRRRGAAAAAEGESAGCMRDRSAGKGSGGVI